jgi:site-specific recombinase XerD
VTTTTTKQEIIPDLVYRNFIGTCRTPSTRYIYKKSLEYFLSYLRLGTGDYVKLLDMDTKIVQMNICDYISYLRNQKGLASQTVTSYVSAIRKFYVMNDVQLNWEKIHSFKGEEEKRAEDRPYTHAEISIMLQRTTPRNRCIILLMCSGGLRVGSIPSLRVKDLEPIDKYNIFKVNVYASSKRSSYFSFCSVEARKEIDQYLEWRRRLGEHINPESPLFRTEFSSLQIQQPHPLTRSGIRFHVNKLLRDTGIRPPIPFTEFHKHYRSHIMECHAFRKFFEKSAVKAGMDLIYVRRLMGQDSGLEDSYLKLSEEELLEGDDRHVGYIGIIDQLTIDEAQKLKREVETLRVQKTEMEELKAEIDKVKALLGQG